MGRCGGGGKMIWCGDFNAHNEIWGSGHTDGNGAVVEEYMEGCGMVCVNEGGGTRVNIGKGTESCLDLMWVSAAMAGRCEWRVMRDSTVGSDHYPIVCRFEAGVCMQSRGHGKRWCYEKADWIKFKYLCEREGRKLTMEGSVNECAQELTSMLVAAAEVAIPVSKGGGRRRVVPWWTDECSKRVRERNKAFRALRRSMTDTKVLEYQRKRAETRRTIKRAKREAWREFCSTIGMGTDIGRVWKMFRKMLGKGGNAEIPVLVVGDAIAMTGKEKADALGVAFAKVHSGEHLCEESKRRRCEILKQKGDVLHKKAGTEEVMDAEFTKFELTKALVGCRRSAPGEDRVGYEMVKKAPDNVMEAIVGLFNKVWRTGVLPDGWKQAVVLPFAKPGKDPGKVDSYRPIALTSNLCKLMEKMIVKRLIFYLESKGLMSEAQSGFRRGRSTMDALVVVSTEIAKALAMKEKMVVVYFDIEKAYDTMWREGVLMKLSALGVEGRMYNWILDFLFDRYIQVRVGTILSERYEVANGTPQGSVISPVLFTIMIDDVFRDVGRGMGRALYADDGALWKRGKNEKFVMRKMQEAVDVVEEWSKRWGFRMSVTKSCFMVYSRRRVGEVRLHMYGQELGRVLEFKYLGLWFDGRLTWRKHVEFIEQKCRKVLNLMRAVAGVDWGADRRTLLCMYQALEHGAVQQDIEGRP
uniref:Reverse transcriptase domain-containing protein n=1 Tax=Gasterosteus aculeatus aculeatus TaxID=481459 RepID=A0AAQ4RRK9_GASAC